MNKVYLQCNDDDSDICFLTLLAIYKIRINQKQFTIIIIIAKDLKIQELACARRASSEKK